MLAPGLDTLRLTLHVLAASIWVGGQIALADLVGPSRAFGPEAPRVLARAFARLAWPAFAVLVLTGFWNVSTVHWSQQSDGMEDGPHRQDRRRGGSGPGSLLARARHLADGNRRVGIGGWSGQRGRTRARGPPGRLTPPRTGPPAGLVRWAEGWFGSNLSVGSTASGRRRRSACWQRFLESMGSSS